MKREQPTPPLIVDYNIGLYIKYLFILVSLKLYLLNT